MASGKVARKVKKTRAQRATSNIFAMFDQNQIAEFKEAFNLIDQNHDEFIDKDDLRSVLNSLGQNPTDEFLEEMMSEAPGSVNFTMFLTLFGEKLAGSDPEDVIKNAFACFDTESTGKMDEEKWRERERLTPTRLRDVLLGMGDRFSEDEVNDFFRHAPVDGSGKFDYMEFIRSLKHGSKDSNDSLVE